MTVRQVIGIVLATLLVGLAAYACLITGQLRDARTERDAALAELTQAYRSIEVLAVEREAADRRTAIVQASRESIVAAPETDDGPVAPVLQQALDAADQIGGIQ